MTVIPYSDEKAQLWDHHVAAFPMHTFLHTRRFLSYHGNRFRDQSVFLTDTGGEVVGAFPAAVDPDDQQIIVSHPGITYGGLLHGERLRGEEVLLALQQIGAYYGSRGFTCLRYKAIPHMYHQVPAEDDLYALFRLGARRYRCDLSATIDLHGSSRPSERRARGQKKAAKHGLEIVEGAENIERVWNVLAENLGRKHGVRPVHSLDEICTLHALFPDNIRFIAGIHNGQVQAGLVLFVTATTVHAQYIASSEVGQSIAALDAVFAYAIGQARDQGFRYFDFGISTEKGGTALNSGLYQFKREFGAGGTVHDFYEIALGASKNGA